MSVILAIGLLVYILFLLFFVVHSLFLIYHLVRFSIRRDRARAFAGLFAVISSVLLIVSLSLLLRVQWDAPLTVPLSGTTPFSQVR